MKYAKSGKLEGLTILRRKICEGNIEKMSHLRVRQFQGVPFAMGNMQKVGNLRVRQFSGVPFARETCKKWATWEWNMEKGFDNFKAYHLRGKHCKSGPLEGSRILRRTICKGNSGKKWATLGFDNFKVYQICEGNIEKMGNLRVRQFQGVPFARETWKEWVTWGFDNFQGVPFARETLKKWETLGFDNFKT